MAGVPFWPGVCNRPLPFFSAMAWWPCLQPEQLVGPGDLAITIDYRDVLGEIIGKRLNNPRLADVFPGYTVNEVDLAIPRT